jgi:YcaO-like protein with predicted kinase domain
MNSIKTFKSGTHRSATPLETLEKIKKFLPVFGITRVANITGMDKIGIPVVTAIRPNSRSLATSQGKGVTIEAAKVSALMESIEGFHAENIFQEAINISYEDLVYRSDTVDISGIARSYNSPFDTSERILWLRGIDFMNQKEVWVPYDAVSTDFSVSQKPTSLISDSNGLSSGNTGIESLLHGIYEVIERDALALFFHAPHLYEDRKIDLNSIQSSENIHLLNLINNANVSVGIWDITSDIGIPTYICKTIDRGEIFEISSRPTYGSGTHLDSNIALSRAITEAAQSRATFISGSRDDQPLENYINSYSVDSLNKWKIDISGINYSPVSHHNIFHETFEEDFEYLLGALSNSGIKQAIYVDLTKPELGIPVSKVIIPHLEGITNTHDRATGFRIGRIADGIKG